MKAEGKDRKVIDEFNLKHGIMDEGSSMIVLETARQYLEFGITPPESDGELHARWSGRRKVLEKNRERHLEQLAAAWKERCDHLAKPVTPVAGRLRKQAEARSRELTELAKLNPGVGPGLVEPLQGKLAEIAALTADEIAASEVAAMKQLLEEAQAFEEDLEKKVPWIQVTIGGQVRRPGKLTLPSGSTLREGIEAAGGETPYGAMNRVKLYRGGKVFSFDLRKAANEGVRLRSRDVVEVAQTMIFGNGGSGKAGTAPFSDPGSSKMRSSWRIWRGRKRSWDSPGKRWPITGGPCRKWIPDTPGGALWWRWRK